MSDFSWVFFNWCAAAERYAFELETRQVRFSMSHKDNLFETRQFIWSGAPSRFSTLRTTSPELS